MSLESFPAVTLLSLRFLLSGAIMLIGALIARVGLPRGRELWLTAIYGVLVLGVGTGSLVFAEEWVPSGLASLFVTVYPFWLVGVEALFPGGEPLYGPSIRGMLVGCAGVVILILPALTHLAANHGVLIGFLLLQLGAAAWSIGSIFQRKQPSKVHPFVSGAVQQFATGLAYVIPALLTKSPVHWTARGTGAVIYLVFFGSIVGYSSYIYAMDRLPVAIASIYTYVNPIVAVALGWIFYREPFGLREAMAAAVVFIGVAMVKRASVPVKKLSADQAPENG